MKAKTPAPPAEPKKRVCADCGAPVEENWQRCPRHRNPGRGRFAVPEDDPRAPRPRRRPVAPTPPETDPQDATDVPTSTSTGPDVATAREALPRKEMAPKVT